MFDENQIKNLEDEIDTSRIKTRSKGNINLSYIEGHDVIETANKVFGFGNWSYCTSKLDQVSQEVNQNQNNVVCYKAIVQVKVFSKNHTLDILREDVGFGTGTAKTLADAHEGGAKEAITDGLKRALRSFGNQFGNSLYDKSKNHNTNTQAQGFNNTNNQLQNFNQQQNYNQAPNNYQQNNSYQNAQNQYQHQQDFQQLINLGLQVIQKGEHLIVVGENVFANKDVIKNHGFRWDGSSKTWYMQLRQAA